MIHQSYILFLSIVLLSGYVKGQQVDPNFSNKMDQVDSLMDANLRDEAIKLLNTIGASYAVDEDPEMMVMYYDALGSYHLQAGQYIAAIKHFEMIKNLVGITDREILLKQAKSLNDLGIAYVRNGSPQEAKQAHFHSLKLYERFDDDQGQSFNFGNLAIIYKEEKLLDSALYFLGKGEASAIAAKDSIGMAYHAMNRGILYLDNRQPIKGLEMMTKAKNTFGKLQEEQMVQYTNQLLANLYSSIKDFNQARPLFLEASNYFFHEKNYAFSGNTRLGLAEMFFKLEEFDSGLYQVNQALHLFDSVRYVKGLVKAYYLKGEYHYKTDDLEQAIVYFEKSIKESKGVYKGTDKNSLLWLAHIYIAQGNFELANQLADSARTVATGNPNEGAVKLYHEAKFQISQFRNESKESIKHLQILLKIAKENFNQEKANEIARIEYQHQLEIEQDKLHQQEKLFQTELEKRNILIRSGLIAFGLVVLILILIYRSYLSKKKTNQQLTAKHQEVLELRESEKKLASEMMALKERELTTTVMLAHEKNKVLEKLDSSVNVLADRVDQEVIPDIKEIKKTIQSSITEDSWSIFTYQFEKVHPEFFSKLKELFPNLTQHDLRLCAYLKAGMDNREIAVVSNITSEAVRKSIQRMRKKMDLSLEVDIREMLLNF